MRIRCRSSRSPRPSTPPPRMGRLTLNVLLSFAQFEREVTSERIRDKIAASKQRGLWVGGMVPLGYASQDKKLVVVDGGGRAGAADLPPLSRARQPRQAAGRAARHGHRHQGAASCRTGAPSAALPSRAVRWPICCATASTSARSSIAAASARPSTPPILERELFEAVQARLTDQHRGFTGDPQQPRRRC